MSAASVSAAPLWRRLLAGLADAGIGLVVTRAARSRLGTGRSAPRLLRLLGPGSELVRQQLGSPGQRLLGVSTIDRRTGQRVAAWRSLVLFALAVGEWLVTTRLLPRETPHHARERARVMAEAEAIARRHPGDVEARHGELMALFRRTEVPSVGPAIAASLAFGAVNALLRRRFAPTVEISAEPVWPHSP